LSQLKQKNADPEKEELKHSIESKLSPQEMMTAKVLK